jgi:hypothetical protein
VIDIDHAPVVVLAWQVWPADPQLAGKVRVGLHRSGRPAVASASLGETPSAPLREVK